MINNNWQIEKLLNPKNEKITKGELVTGEFENFSILAVNLNKTRHHTMIYLGKTVASEPFTWVENDGRPSQQPAGRRLVIGGGEWQREHAHLTRSRHEHGTLEHTGGALCCHVGALHDRSDAHSRQLLHVSAGITRGRNNDNSDFIKHYYRKKISILTYST